MTSSPDEQTKPPFDVLVVGAGPAGLTGAIYLARFHLRIIVVDAGASRAASIPRTHNHAGYPGGIAGQHLIDLMREQAAEFGVEVRHGTVERLSRDGDLFHAESNGVTLAARSVLLATGVVNNRPPIPDDLHHRAVADGLIRYCPICDGYEVTDKRIGVIGSQTHGHNEAVFLRMYSRNVTLISPDAELALSEEERDRLQSLGIATLEGPCGELKVQGNRITVPTPEGPQTFDTIYPALGSDIRSQLAVDLGAEANDQGCLVVDAHQRTTVPGLYAAGDVTKGLDQISHAMGEAGVAAVTIRNDFAQHRLLAR